MAAADSVRHLHLGQVDVLRSLAQLLACHGILYEGRVGYVGRWEPETHVRTLGLFLVGALGLHLSLPIHQFLELSLIMLAKSAHDGLYKMT